MADNRFGTFRGKKISLEEAEKRLTAEELSEVEVRTERGIVRPYRVVSTGKDIKFDKAEKKLILP